MTYRPAPVPPGAVPAPAIEARLEPDAIGVTQDVVIGTANAAPAVAVALTLAPLAATAAYGSGPVIIACGAPMLIIANSYRRLNLWKANCGASFEWVGHAISPYLGFLTGWLMIAGNLIGTTASTAVLGPSVLAVAGQNAASTWPDIAISTAVIVVMLVIAVAGIRITVRTQVGMAAVEYAILAGFAIAGFWAVLGHHHGTYPVTKGWFSLSGIAGKGSLAAGPLLAVFMYTGWDATVYVNEEVTHRRVNPGRSAVFAAAFLVAIFTVATAGLQGVVSPARFQAHSSSALVYVAQALGGSGWAKVMALALALALALSVIATTGVSIVILARIMYAMASHRVLPAFVGKVSPRFKTPAVGSILTGLTLITILWAYLLSSSIASAFTQLIDVTGILTAGFYILTALATIVYYRHRVFSNAWDAQLAGILPFAAAAFLAWIVVRSLQAAPASQQLSVAGTIAVGMVVMLVARSALRSTFFQIPCDSASREP